MSGTDVGTGDRQHRSGPHAPRIGFRPDIEGLRAVAILLVVLDHLGMPGFAAGFTGVDIFFVISGFLITSLLAAEYRSSKEVAGKGHVSLRGFYARRARRILPAALTVIAATLLVAKLEWNPVRFAEVQADALWATFFAANIHTMARAADYFAWWTPMSPLQNYWSLAVEEQFYLVWPALFGLAAAGFGLARRANPERWARRVFATVTVVSIASLVFSALETVDDPRATYFSTFARAWQLGLGAMVALFWLARPAPGRLGSTLAAVTGVALIVTGLVVIDRGTAFPGLIALLPTCGAALLIIGGIDASVRTPVAAALSVPPIRFVGRISYSLYLWHWPIVVFAAAMVSRRSLGGFERGAALFAVCIAVAWLSWLLIEQPFRRLRFDTAPALPKRLAMGGLTVSVIAVLALFARPMPSGTPVTTSLASFGEPTAKQWQAQVESASKVTVLPPNQRSALAAQQFLGPSRKCATTENRFDVADCRAAATGGTWIEWPTGRAKLAVLAGDSYAAQWRDALLAALPTGVEVTQVTDLACDPFTLRPPPEGALRKACLHFRSWMPRAVESLHPGLVVIGHATTASPELVGDFARTMKQRGAAVLWLGPTPDAPRVAKCLPKGSADVTPCNGPLFPLDFKLGSAYSRAAAVSGAAWLDLAKVYCTPSVCPAVIDGKPVRTGFLGGLTVPSLDAGKPWLREGVVRASGAKLRGFAGRG